MAAGKHNLTICQGSVFEHEFVLRDAVTRFGSDLISGPSEIRMQIRIPDRTAADPPLFDVVSGTPTALGSSIDVSAEEVIAATAITDFQSDGVVEATGAGFQQSVLIVGELDPNTGNPTSLTTITEDVAIIADKAVISGSTSNDGDYRVEEVQDADTLKLSPAPTVEPAAGTIRIDRQGRFALTITAEESDTWDFAAGEYDIEWVSSPGEQPVRLVQGKVKLDKQATR